MASGQNLRRALKALARVNGSSQWCGYLPAMQILALVQEGAVCGSPDADSKAHFDAQVKLAEERRRKGDGQCWWFYFKPSAKLLPQIQREHPIKHAVDSKFRRNSKP